jgi:hypothetical protein
MTKISRFELLVLAALERPKPPSERDLASDVQRLAAPNTTASEARARVVETLASLRDRRLTTEKRKLTDEGRASAKAALGLSRSPSWKDFKLHAAALALGRAPGSIEAQRCFATSASLQANILVVRFELEPTNDIRAVCEQLLFGRLQLPAFAVRDKRLLMHVLAHHAGIEAKGKLEQVAGRIAAATIGARSGSKQVLIEALARRWLSNASLTEPDDASLTEEIVLDVVREAIGRVPASGRFGEDKVFISSLWETIAGDTRANGIDLPAFKRWLLEANAKQSLVLARADLVGAMDPSRVAASEILDRGASFHFVLDNR